MTFKKCTYPRRLNRPDAADYIDRARSTLDNWARSKAKKKNIEYVIMGNKAYYDVADLDAYLKVKQTF